MERTFACLTEQDWGYLEDSMADEYAGQGAGTGAEDERTRTVSSYHLIRLL